VVAGRRRRAGAASARAGRRPADGARRCPPRPRTSSRPAAVPRRGPARRGRTSTDSRAPSRGQADASGGRVTTSTGRVERATSASGRAARAVAWRRRPRAGADDDHVRLLLLGEGQDLVAGDPGADRRRRDHPAAVSSCAAAAPPGRPLGEDAARDRRESLELDLVDAEDRDRRAGLAREVDGRLGDPRAVQLGVGGEHEVHGSLPAVRSATTGTVPRRSPLRRVPAGRSSTSGARCRSLVPGTSRATDPEVRMSAPEQVDTEHGEPTLNRVMGPGCSCCSWWATSSGPGVYALTGKVAARSAEPCGCRSSSPSSSRC
jgi:hypothetical protein